MGISTVLLVEDDPSTLALLQDLLEEDGATTVICETPDRAVEVAADLPRALLLADFWGESHAALSTDERDQIVRLASAVPTILVTGRAWAEPAAASDLGLVALVRKPFDIDELRQIVASWTARAINDSEAEKRRSRDLRVRMDGAMEQIWVARARLRRLADGARGQSLTPRQHEIASLVAEGLTNAEIGERLTVTPGTVSNHLEHIKRSLGLRNRVQIAVWAVEHGHYRSGKG